MLVEVTQENINQGVAGKQESCPVALAMQENGLENVRVDARHILYNQQPTPLQFHVSQIKMDTLVRKWIYDFDGGKEVFPIKIEIDEDAGYATLVE